MVHIGVYRIQIQDVYLSPLYTLHDTLVLIIKGVSFSLFEFLPRKAAKSSPQSYVQLRANMEQPFLQIRTPRIGISMVLVKGCKPTRREEEISFLSDPSHPYSKRRKLGYFSDILHSDNVDKIAQLTLLSCLGPTSSLHFFVSCTITMHPILTDVPLYTRPIHALLINNTP